MVPSPQVPTRESRGDGGDVPKTGWREEMFAAALAIGDCRYVALRLLRGESVRAWLGTVAMWRVSPRLVVDCRYVALRPLHGESVRAWLGTVAMWRVSPRLLGDCRYVASQSALGWGLSLCGESVRA
ncbi:hypothetical protein ACLB2K_012620 [Fragaria x ananassa]